MHPNSRTHGLPALALLLIVPALAQMPAHLVQSRFATPEEAAQALREAAKAKDQTALTAIFGPDRAKLLTGDPVEDNSALEHFPRRHLAGVIQTGEGD